MLTPVQPVFPLNMNGLTSSYSERLSCSVENTSRQPVVTEMRGADGERGGFMVIAAPA
jgi:hypothetical protein